MHESVTVPMAATPGRIGDLVSDVTRIGRYRPEAFEAARGRTERNKVGTTLQRVKAEVESGPGGEA